MTKKVVLSWSSMAQKKIVDHTTNLPEQFCPYCFHRLDSATSFDTEESPQPGDFTVCISCANILRYGEGMSLHASSLMEIPAHSRMEFAKMVGLCKMFPKKPSSVS